MVGAPSTEPNCQLRPGPCGAVYVFNFDGTGWLLVQTLVADDALSRTRFGTDVSMDGSWAIVGAPGDGSPANFCPTGTTCGSAYMFRRSGDAWTRVVRLNASDGEAGDFLGESVGINDYTVVGGAKGDDCPASTSCGAAYVFDYDVGGWSESQKLTSTERPIGLLFGNRVAISGSTIAVTAPGDDCTAQTPCDGVYVFENTTGSWDLANKLTLPAENIFGSGAGGNVALFGKTLVASHTRAEICTDGVVCAAANVYQRNETDWDFIQRLSPSDSTTGAYGDAVAMTADHVIIGALQAWCPGFVGCGATFSYDCVSDGEHVPATTHWGLAATLLMALCVGTIVFRSTINDRLAANADVA